MFLPGMLATESLFILLFFSKQSVSLGKKETGLHKVSQVVSILYTRESNDVSLVDRYSNFIRPSASTSTETTTKIAEDFCVSVEEQERILREISSSHKSSTVQSSVTAIKKSPEHSSTIIR